MPRDGPRISGGRGAYSVGDRVSSIFSDLYPKAHFFFTLNPDLDLWVHLIMNSGPDNEFHQDLELNIWRRRRVGDFFRYVSNHKVLSLLRYVG